MTDDDRTIDTGEKLPSARGGLSTTGGGGPVVVARQAAPEPPRGLTGRYEVGERLGAGGMGVVHLVRDASLDRLVALKALRSDRVPEPGAAESLREEAVVLAALDHPGALPVYEIGSLPSGEPYYTMKRVRGRTLKDLLQDRSRAEVRSRESLAHFVDVFERVCQTVAAAHGHGIVHCDLKPANVMVDELGAVYVLDWGIALRVSPGAGAAAGIEPGTVFGTPAYMSPEQAKGAVAEIGPASDVFSLGSILYEILTGISPFGALDGRESMQKVVSTDPIDPLRLNRAAGRALSAICRKALSKRIANRYPSARELADEIRRYREFRPVEAIPPALHERVTNWARRKPALAATLGTALGGALLVGLGVASLAVSRAALLSAASGQLAGARAAVVRLDERIRQLEERSALVRGVPEEEARLKRQVAELRAVRTDFEEYTGTMSMAILGFTAERPDPAAQAYARNLTLSRVESHLARGEDLAAIVAIRRALRTYEARNVAGLDARQAEELRRKLAAAEERRRAEGLEVPPPEWP